MANEHDHRCDGACGCGHGEHGGHGLVSGSGAPAAAPAPEAAAPHMVDIADLASMIEIQAEATVSRTVLKEDGLRTVLFAFDRDQVLTEHTAAMPVMIQVLSGLLRIGAEGREVELAPGGVVYLGTRQPHTVHAVEPSKMVLSMFDNRG